MEAGFIALAVLLTVIGIVAGIHIEKSRAKNRIIKGVLNIVCDNLEDTPQLFLQLTAPIEDIVGQKTATFNVNVIR